MIHVPIEPMSVYIRKEYLYNMDPSYVGTFASGKVFALSSYPQEALTFQILLEDGCLFSYISVQALQLQNQVIEAPLSPQDLIYKNSPGAEIVVSYHSYLQGDVLVYFKTAQKWLKGTYILTVDWYEDNEQFHWVSLENGQFAFSPNHKIKFRSAEETFPPYKKLRQTWSV